MDTAHVLGQFDGPVLVERLNFLATHEASQDGALAALEALRYLDRESQYSPLIDTLVDRAAQLLNQSDDVAAQIQQFQNPMWGARLSQRKTDALKELNAENLYHEKDIPKIITAGLVYTFDRHFPEAISVLSMSGTTSSVCVLAEHSAHAGLLQGNYSHVSAQDKRVDMFVSTSLSNDMYRKRLTEEEVSAHWRTKILALFGSFLKQNFEEASRDAYDLVNASPITTVTGKSISMMDLFDTPGISKFVSKDEILIGVAISVLLTRPPEELPEVLGEPEFTTIMGSFLSEIRDIFIAMHKAKYREVFELLGKMTPYAESSFFLSKVWNPIQLKFRRKSYKLYLSLIKRAKIEHLATKLTIDKEILLKELKDLIREEKLEYRLIEDDSIVEEFKSDNKEKYFERLQKLAELTDSLETTITSRMEEDNKQSRKSRNSAQLQRNVGGTNLRQNVEFPISSGSGFISTAPHKTPPGDSSASFE